MSGELYSAVVLICVYKPLVYCESLSPGVHMQMNDHTEGRFHTAYKSSIRAWVQTARGFLQLHCIRDIRRGEPGTVHRNGTLDDCTLYLIIGHL